MAPSSESLGELAATLLFWEGLQRQGVTPLEQPALNEAASELAVKCGGTASSPRPHIWDRSGWR